MCGLHFNQIHVEGTHHLAESEQSRRRPFAIRFLFKQTLWVEFSLIRHAYHLLKIYLYFIIFFFSDARNMARDVHNVLLKILKEHGVMDTEKAENYIKKMQNKGRYSCDVWSWYGYVLSRCFKIMNLTYYTLFCIDSNCIYFSGIIFYLCKFFTFNDFYWT